MYCLNVSEQGLSNKSIKKEGKWLRRYIILCFILFQTDLGPVKCTDATRCRICFLKVICVYFCNRESVF